MWIKNFDVTDYLSNGNIEKIAEIAARLDPEIRNTYIPTPEEVASRNAEDFAVTLYHPKVGIMHKYALYTRGLAQLNLSLLASQIDELPDEVIKVAAINLQGAAEHYGLIIPEELRALKEADILGISTADGVKAYTEASNTNMLVDLSEVDQVSYKKKLTKAEKKSIQHLYALPKDKKYPITTEALVKKANAYFAVHHKGLPISDRVIFAENLKIQLEKYGMRVEPMIEKLANLHYGKLNEDFALHIKARQSMTTDEDVKDLYGELLDKSAEWPLVKVASALNKVDKHAGLTSLYNIRIEDPINTVFCKEKIAEYVIDGRTWTEPHLEKIASLNLTSFLEFNDIRGLSGNRVVEVFKSLPQPIREKIANEIF